MRSSVQIGKNLSEEFCTNRGSEKETIFRVISSTPLPHFCRSKVFQTMSEFSIPAKNARLFKMTLIDTGSPLKMGISSKSFIRKEVSRKQTAFRVISSTSCRKKLYETQIDTYHLFLHYKTDFDSPLSSKVFQAMSEFGSPAKVHPAL